MLNTPAPSILSEPAVLLSFCDCNSVLFWSQASQSGLNPILQAYYACKTSLFCFKSIFFAMTKFTRAQDTKR